jgi:hypothetical protein
MHAGVMLTHIVLIIAATVFVIRRGSSTGRPGVRSMECLVSGLAYLPSWRLRNRLKVKGQQHSLSLRFSQCFRSQIR